jgi:hypothetical protein
MMVKKLEWMWKEAIASNLSYFSRIYLDGLGKPTKNDSIACFQAEIRIGDLPNTTKDC